MARETYFGSPEVENSDDIDLRPSSAGPHAEAVQALRKYLLHKVTSEECTPGKVFSVAELEGSKLYCSLIKKPEVVADKPHHQQQGNKKCLAKHQSLELDDSKTQASATAGLRYLRTDLCIPVLWSKCSFCDEFFENEEQLRTHLRDSHFQYFLNYMQMRPLTSTKSLSDLPFSSALQISQNAQKEGADQFEGTKYSHPKKSVQCQVCQKYFTSKWNCKQHSNVIQQRKCTK